jgi:hypothetical protein
MSCVRHSWLSDGSAVAMFCSESRAGRAPRVIESGLKAASLKSCPKAVQEEAKKGKSGSPRD